MRTPEVADPTVRLWHSVRNGLHELILGKLLIKRSSYVYRDVPCGSLDLRVLFVSVLILCSQSAAVHDIRKQVSRLSSA
jgi:hypothetical protein